METVLSPRLEAALTLAGASECAADVGCDHGYLTAALIERGLACSVIASDISADSLAKTRRLVAERGIGDRVTAVRSDGLGHLSPGEAEHIFILGMGGITISGILAAGPGPAARAELILQPQGTLGELRAFLGENGYGVTAEKLAEDGGRIYHLLRARRGAAEPEWSWPRDDGPLSPNLLNDPLLPKYASQLRRRAEAALAEAATSGAEPGKPARLLRQLEAAERLIGGGKWS